MFRRTIYIYIPNIVVSHVTFGKLRKHPMLAVAIPSYLLSPFVFATLFLIKRLISSNNR